MPSPYERQRPSTTARVEAGEELRGEPRLADAGAPEDREQRTRVSETAALPRVREQPPLALASDERRVRAPLRTAAPPVSERSRYAVTGSDLPFASIGGTSSASTASRTSW